MRWKKLVKAADKIDEIRMSILSKDVEEVKEAIKDLDVNTANKIGDTPIIMATLFGTPEIVKVLLDAGADPTIKGGTGKSAIDYAKALRKEDILSLFN